MRSLCDIRNERLGRLMIVSLAKIDCDKIHDWESMHDEFDSVFGFPGFYGRTMNAWIDCMTSIDEPEDALSEIHCEKDGFLTIELENVAELKRGLRKSTTQ